MSEFSSQSPRQDEDSALPFVNTTTKEDLLRRAKAAIRAGEQSLQEAAEALGLAQEGHAATQREMAEAVGRSASWVNALLKWRASGYKDDSPFDLPRSRLAAKHGTANTTSAHQNVCVQQAEQPPDYTPTRPRGAAAADRDDHRTAGSRQLDDCVEEIKKIGEKVTKIVSSSIFDNATREMFRRTHSPYLDAFIDERGFCRFKPLQFTAIEPPRASGPRAANPVEDRECSNDDQGA